MRIYYLCSQSVCEDFVTEEKAKEIEVSFTDKIFMDDFANLLGNYCKVIFIQNSFVIIKSMLNYKDFFSFYMF